MITLESVSAESKTLRVELDTLDGVLGEWLTKSEALSLVEKIKRAPSASAGSQNK